MLETEKSISEIDSHQEASELCNRVIKRDRGNLRS